MSEHQFSQKTSVAIDEFRQILSRQIRVNGYSVKDVYRSESADIVFADDDRSVECRNHLERVGKTQNLRHGFQSVESRRGVRARTVAEAVEEIFGSHRKLLGSKLDSFPPLSKFQQIRFRAQTLRCIFNDLPDSLPSNRLVKSVIHGIFGDAAERQDRPSRQSVIADKTRLQIRPRIGKQVFDVIHKFMLGIDMISLDLRQRFRQLREHSGFKAPFAQAFLHDFQLPAIAARDR